MKLTRSCLAFLIIFFSLPIQRIEANALEKVNTVYWWSSSRTPVVHFAAEEIRQYYYKMARVNMQVVEISRPKSCYTEGIVIVYRQFSFPDHLPCTEIAVEDGYYIKADAGYILLAGNNDRGTLYAAYAVLEKHGTRFFAPNFPFYNGMAEQVSPRKSIRLVPFEEIQYPDYPYRRKYVENGFSHTLKTMIALIDWMAKNKLNTLVVPTNYSNLNFTVWDTWRLDLIPELEKRGMILEVGGHGYETFLPPAVYKTAHPDWFGSATEPVVGTNPKPPANVFRITNEEALQTYLDNVVAYLRARPEIQIFDAWPPDGARWIKRDIDSFGSVANAQSYVTRRLQDRLAQEGLNVIVETIAYQFAIDPPDPEYMYRPDTIIDFAPSNRSYREMIFEPGSPQNEFFNQRIEMWNQSGFQGTLGIYEYYRKYAWRSWPNTFTNLILAEVPYYYSKNFRGIGIYSEPGDWVTYELVHYLTAALAWNTRLDGQQFARSYRLMRYGNVQLKMANYFSLVEQAGRQMFISPSGDFGNLAVVEGVRDQLTLAKKVLTNASQFANQPQAKHLINLLLINQDYAIQDVNISYYLLTGDTANSEIAKTTYKNLMDQYRFSGIILQSYFSIYRYNPTVRQANLGWIYRDYRAKFDGLASAQAVFEHTQFIPFVVGQEAVVDSDEYLPPFEESSLE